MNIRQSLFATLAAALVMSAAGCAVTRGQESVGAYVDDTAITTALKELRLARNAAQRAFDTLRAATGPAAARSQAAMQEARDAMEQALVKVTADLHAPPRDTRPVADPGPAAEVVAESVPDSPPTSTSPSTTQPEKEATP